ncbi:LytR C-terminal domain-containing protein [Mycobacterium sp. NPDC051804]|uniref:LytR C-terminal domain-containing protein n=1 Tax=Mycobacterium sp. NPDC051804 TaxID=3364295 RepID=UPI0037B6A35D
MNQQNSSGLPLRAMVMVLLFLGVVFLLVGFQAMGGGDDDGDQSSIATSTQTTTTSASPTESPEPAKPEVRVFNISTVQGAAEGTANRLREGGWTVAETGNLELPDVTANTVYFTDAPGEREAAEEVGKLLDAPVEPRLPELAEQPPGVLVVVTG